MKSKSSNNRSQGKPRRACGTRNSNSRCWEFDARLLLKDLGEFRLQLPRVGFDPIVVDRIERHLVEARQARRWLHVNARRVVPLLRELVLDLPHQVELSKQLCCVRMR